MEPGCKTITAHRTVPKAGVRTSPRGVAAIQQRTPRNGPFAASEYAGLQADACRGLLESLRDLGTPTIERRHEPGDLVCGEDEYGSALYIVLEGVAKLSVVCSEAREAILRLAGPWEAIGVPVPGWRPSQPTRAEAFTACEIVKVPKAFVERAVRESPEVALNLTTLLGLELARREELFTCLLPRTTEARLARLLPILARQFGEARDGCWTIELRLTHYDLAEMVASTRESVTAAVNALRRRGVLEKKAGIVSILKPEELAETAASWAWPGRSAESRSGVIP
jgi:CRP/FNR family transcriptional regulator, global nitrogen regulator